LYFDCNGRYLEALHETRCGYYDGQEEIKSNVLFKKRFKQSFMRIQDYSEEVMWIPNTGRQYICDEEDFYREYYNEVWNIY